MEKLQELTEKIYTEGVEKGRAEAVRIVSEAEAQAKKIVEEARKKAADISARAELEALELKKRSEAEISLAGRHSINAIRQRISDMIVTRVVEAQIAGSISSHVDLKALIEAAIKSWSSSAEGSSIEIVLPESSRSSMEEFFRGEILKTLSGKLEITYSDSVKNGFRIGPADGGYKISLTEEDFAEFFKGFLKPMTREMLFGK
jgi:V/A-type H+-transporting ATPase subunit E